MGSKLLQMQFNMDDIHTVYGNRHANTHASTHNLKSNLLPEDSLGKAAEIAQWHSQYEK